MNDGQMFGTDGLLTPKYQGHDKECASKVSPEAEKPVKQHLADR